MLHKKMINYIFLQILILTISLSSADRKVSLNCCDEFKAAGKACVNTISRYRYENGTFCYHDVWKCYLPWSLCSITCLWYAGLIPCAPRPDGENMVRDIIGVCGAGTGSCIGCTLCCEFCDRFRSQHLNERIDMLMRKVDKDLEKMK